MAKVGTAGSPRPLLPVRDSDNLGDVIIEIDSKTDLVPNKKDPSKQNLQLRGQVVETLYETPETDPYGNDVLGQFFIATVWIDQTSTSLWELLSAAGIEVDDDGWDTEDLHGKRVGVRYRHGEYPKGSGELTVDVRKYYEVD